MEIFGIEVAGLIRRNRGSISEAPAKQQQPTPRPEEDANVWDERSCRLESGKIAAAFLRLADRSSKTRETPTDWLHPLSRSFAPCFRSI
jgi:hypothetical protein